MDSEEKEMIESPKGIFESLRDSIWEFVGYYKYTFSYQAENEQYRMTIWLGGDAGDIYRMELGAIKRFADWEFEDVDRWSIWDKKAKKDIYYWEMENNDSL